MCSVFVCFFFKQKTAYEMRISDWSSDVCSSDLVKGESYMTTHLGLDIGTNSIGWCLYDSDSIRDIGVRIFSDGRDPKSGASLAVDRRNEIGRASCRERVCQYV